ncbi:hypothetical protein TVAG_150330 [Trichomonas vaginalis G3]|nr:lung seven transmembrane receptor family [Trichomonas vaginalis G3]EAY16882.1 hypothetical protein TVAG_150330 [Trichomonas vaginalis G3]KAI5489130.1 lung seven transmembrane receptor family [Trichomonas vaginalis G3]|eukprot:XP_001329105.1 hypothetical protein [Trichomonas vaginalis G3]
MIIVNINGVELEIKGHLYVIHERGIDPSTTPVFKQFVTYHRYKTVILIYIHFVFANTLISCIADEIPYWLSDLINDFADLFISFASAILFVSIKNVSSGYSNIDAQSVYLEDIQELGIENDVFQNHNLTKWEDGMELPLKPQLINKSNEHESSEGHPQNVDGEFDTSML